MQYGDKPRVSALDTKRNPLLISILDAVDTLKNMEAQGKLPHDAITNAKGLLTMLTNKVMSAGLKAQHPCAGQQTPEETVAPAVVPGRSHYTSFVQLPLSQVGFGVSVTQGYGLVVARLPNSPVGW